MQPVQLPQDVFAIQSSSAAFQDPPPIYKEADDFAKSNGVA